MDDLYRVLGAPPTATAKQLREALTRARWQLPPAEFRRAQQAYSILGDPRLREEYDRGRVVGTGVGQYAQRSRSGGSLPHAAGPKSPTAPRPPTARIPALAIRKPWCRAVLTAYAAYFAAHLLDPHLFPHAVPF